METLSFKALCMAALQRNRGGNNQETESFLGVETRGFMGRGEETFRTLNPPPVTSSLTRQDEYALLSAEVRWWWEAVFFGAQVDGRKNRAEADLSAWETADLITAALDAAKRTEEKQNGTD